MEREVSGRSCSVVVILSEIRHPKRRLCYLNGRLPTGLFQRVTCTPRYLALEGLTIGL